MEIPHSQMDLVDLQKFQGSKDDPRPTKSPIKAYDVSTQPLKKTRILINYSLFLPI